MNIAITILISLLTGVIAGIHSGIVVSRMARFEELRTEAKRQVHSLEYLYDENGLVHVKGNNDFKYLVDVASDLFQLRHRKSGDTILLIRNYLVDVLHNPPETPEEMDAIDQKCQDLCRKLRPNLRIIFHLKPWV